MANEPLPFGDQAEKCHFVFACLFLYLKYLYSAFHLFATVVLIKEAL